MVLYTKLSVVYAVSWKYLLCILCIVKVLWIVYCKGSVDLWIVKVLWIVYCKGIVDLPDQCPSLGTTATNEALSDPPATT